MVLNIFPTQVRRPNVEILLLGNSLDASMGPNEQWIIFQGFTSEKARPEVHRYDLMEFAPQLSRAARNEQVTRQGCEFMVLGSCPLLFSRLRP